MKELVEVIAKALVDEPDGRICYRDVRKAEHTVLELHVADG